MAEHEVVATFQYLKRLPIYKTEKPFHIFFEIPVSAPDQRRTNLEFEDISHAISDTRDSVSSHIDGETVQAGSITSALQDAFTLDTHGFAFRNDPLRVSLDVFGDKTLVEKLYLPEVERLLREVFSGDGVTGIYFFDWRLRSSRKLTGMEMVDMNDLTTWLRPAEQVHIDQSPSAVLHRIELHVPEQEAASLVEGRLRVVNVWRSLGDEPVQDFPLAFCDGSSLRDEDLVECDHIRRKFFGATIYAHHHDSQRWYYLSKQRRHEVTLMKMFDSKGDRVKARACLHGSFRHPRCPDGVDPRRSIEVRALVFTADGNE